MSALANSQSTILAIDDIKHNLILLYQILTNAGYWVLVASSGLDGVRQAQVALPDLILLDILMPDISGYEVCRRLKAEPATQDIPIIFLTALAESVDEVKGLTLGAVDYVRKPFQLEILLARVKTHLTLKQAQRQLSIQNEQLQQKIAERQKLESDLRASETMYRHVVEGSNDGIVIVQDEQIKFCNAQLGSLLAKKVEEIEGHHLATIIAAQDRAQVLTIHRQRLTGERVPIRYETNLLRSDGCSLAVEVSVGVITYHSKPAVLGFIRDITERKKAEARLYQLNETLEQRVSERTKALKSEISERKHAVRSLEQSQDRFQQVITSISDHVYMTLVSNDKAPTNQYVSPNVATLTGYSPEEFIDNWQLWPTQVIYPDDRSAAREHFEQLAAGQSVEIEYRLVKADGDVIWVRDSARVEKTSEGYAIYGVVSNITHRKQNEAQKIQQQQALKEYAQILENLNLVSASINKARTRHQIVQALLVATISITQAEWGVFYSVEDGQLFPSLGGFEMTAQAEATLARYLSAQLQALMSFDTPRLASPLPDLKNNIQPITSGLLVPVKTAGSPLAVIFLGFTVSYQLQEQTESLLGAISDIGGNALQRNIMMETLEQRIADRTRELMALYDVTVLASGDQGLSQVMQEALDKILDAANCEAVTIHLLGDDQTSLQLVAQLGLSHSQAAPLQQIAIQSEWLAEWAGKPLIAPDLSQDSNILPLLKFEQFQSSVLTPMRAKGETVGFLGLFWQVDHSLVLEEVVLVTTIADQLGAAVEIAGLRKRVASTAVLEERQRLVRELHDSVTQSVYSQTLLTRIAQDAFEDGEHEKLLTTLDRLGSNAQHLLKEMRLLLYELRPAMLEQEGLVKALNVRLNTVERRSGVTVHFNVPPQVELPKDIELAFYRVAIEALNNILKHAAAHMVFVWLQIIQEQAILTVGDDGVGFAPEEVGEGGIGLKSMRERAELLGGKLVIDSTPGQGTTIICQVRSNQ